MDSQDTKFNYKILYAAVVAVVIGIVLVFYYSHSQSQNKIDFLEENRLILLKNITLMKAEVDRLTSANEVNEIELQGSKYRIGQLLDSVGRLNFDVDKLSEYKKELRRLELMYDSLKLKNNSLGYNNSILSQKYQETKSKMQSLESKAGKLEEAQAALKGQNIFIAEELKTKNYLVLKALEGIGYRIRVGNPIITNKASTISRLRACVTVEESLNTSTEEKVIYLQFLDPNKKVLAHNAQTINVNGNTYSKKVEFVFSGERYELCDAISMPEGSLLPGKYTLNIFENEKLLSNTEFQLK